jgi:hypothetical protein
MLESICVKDTTDPYNDRKYPYIYGGESLYDIFVNNPDGVTIDAIGKPLIVVKVVGSGDPNFFKLKSK